MTGSRILHVFDQPGATGQAPVVRLSADLAHEDEREAGNRHAWLLVGGAPLRAAARAAGIDAKRFRLTPAPRRLAIPGARRGIRRLLRGAGRVECWTPGAAALVAALGRSDAVCRFGQATLSGMTRAAIARSLTRMGQPVPLPADAPYPREALRGRWGAPDRAIVVALLADQPERVDMRALLLALAFTFETLDACDAPYRDVRLVCHPHTLGRMDAMELAGLLDFSHILIQDAGLLTPWHTLAGCDLAVAPEPLHAGLSIAWAQAMGKPIIAARQPRLPELDELPGLTQIAANAPKHLAKALTDWALALPEPAWAQASVT